MTHSEWCRFLASKMALDVDHIQCAKADDDECRHAADRLRAAQSRHRAGGSPHRWEQCTLCHSIERASDMTPIDHVLPNRKRGRVCNRCVATSPRVGVARKGKPNGRKGNRPDHA